MRIVMQLKLTISNIARKLVAVVSGVLVGRGICRRIAPQAGSNGNTVFAAGRTDSGKVQLVASPRKTALKIYSLRFNIVIALLLLVLGAASRAQAAGVLCSEFSEAGVQGVVDGNNSTTYSAVNAASTFGIDMNCTVKNFPQSMGGFPITNINFNFPGQQSFYIAFTNVYYYGNMSCNDPTQSEFWIYWAPGGYNNISPSCQQFMVPVDAVSKKNPLAQTTATIGVPFTYTITVPLMGKLDATGTFQYIANYDDSEIKNVVITDDLTRDSVGNLQAAALSYVSNTAYLVNPITGARTPLNGGNPLTLGVSQAWLDAHPVSTTLPRLSDDTKHLVFSYENNPAALGSIPAGYHIEIDLTVVLDNNPTVNAAGTSFTNTANTWFNKYDQYDTHGRSPGVARHHVADDNRRARSYAHQDGLGVDHQRRFAGGIHAQCPEQGGERRVEYHDHRQFPCRHEHLLARAHSYRSDLCG